MGTYSEIVSEKPVTICVKLYKLGSINSSETHTVPGPTPAGGLCIIKKEMINRIGQYLKKQKRSRENDDTLNTNRFSLKKIFLQTNYHKKRNGFSMINCVYVEEFGVDICSVWHR